MKRGAREARDASQRFVLSWSYPPLAGAVLWAFLALDLWWGEPGWEFRGLLRDLIAPPVLFGVVSGIAAGYLVQLVFRARGWRA